MIYATQHQTVPYSYPFRYLPSVAYTVGLPLNLLSAWPAYWAWVAVNELLLLTNVYLTWRYASGPRLRLLGSAMWLAFTPVYLEFYMGQFSFLMATLFFWIGLGFARGSSFMTNVPWAVSVVVKTNSLVLFPVWLRMRRYLALLAVLGFAAALNIPYFLLKEGSFDAWKGNFSGFLGDEQAPGNAGALGLRSLLSVIQSLANERPGLALDIGAAIAGAPVWVPMIVGLSALATFAPRRFDAVSALGLWVATYFLIYKDVWEHHYVMLLPVLVLLVILKRQLASLAFFVYLLVALPTPYWLLERLTGGSPPDLSPHYFSDPQWNWSSAQVVGYHLSKAMPTFLLWLGLVYTALQDVSWRSRIGIGRPSAPGRKGAASACYPGR